MTLAEAIAGKEIPEEIKKDLALIGVRFFSFNGAIEEGQLVIHSALAEEVEVLFGKLLELKFPIERIEPVSAYGWDDEASMAANNTSAFNYRYYHSLAHGDYRLSSHSYGRAIDINPVQNPQEREGVIAPVGAVYDETKPGTITPAIAGVFKAHGWDWGGEWTSLKDWQHFEKL